MNKLLSIACPRRLLYLAIDGPAPRAKLNQQRLRRFNAAYDAQTKNMFPDYAEENEEKQDIRYNYECKAEKLDSNMITPGTPFMDRLSVAIRQWIAMTQQKPEYSNLTIIFSDAQTPGEGEHKIMHYIRAQRQTKGYDPNTSHCIHGLDADLIMLALASHEPNFYILREVVFTEKGDVVCRCCG